MLSDASPPTKPGCGSGVSVHASPVIDWPGDLVAGDAAPEWFVRVRISKNQAVKQFARNWPSLVDIALTLDL